MSGSIGILNVGAGDTKLTFDRSNPAEMIRSARIVRDMLRRGYALLVEVTQPDGSKVFQRAIDFREDHAEYIIADFDPTDRGPPPTLRRPLSEADLRAAGETYEQEGEQEAGGEAEATAAPPAPRRGRPRKAVPADTTRAVAVARSAGG